MREEIKTRSLKLAVYILENKSTVRATAKHFGMKKSTVYVDLSKRLKAIDTKLFLKVKNLFDINFKEKHIRGGETLHRRSKIHIG